MYKRKKRRTNKGKKKLSTTTTTTSPSPTPSGAVWTDEPKVAGATGTTSINNIMSVTTMEVAENHHHHQQQQQPPSQQPPRQPVELTTTSNSKAVGARKRKPMQISKIVDKLPMMNDHHHALDFGAEKNLVHNNNNNNNSPPYKKPCLETSKNGMIKNILSELKTAKMGGGGNSRGESLVSSSRDRDRHRRRYERGGDEDDDDDYNDKSDEDEGGLCIKDDGDDEGEEYEDDDDEEGVDYTGSGNEGANYLNNKKQNVYVNTASALSSVPTTALKDRSGAGIGISSSLMRAHHYHHPLHPESLSRDRDSSDLAEIKNILSNTGIPGELRSSASPNGWDRKYLDEDDSANDEGADLRSVTGNSTGDDELPFRCGVCAYGSCDKSTLLRHMRTHSGERPFQCRLCYFAFTTKANCERHLRNRHGQIDRDQLRNLVVCLPTSSNASESETEVNSNSNCGGAGGVVGLGHQPSPVASVEAKVKRTSGSGGGTIVSGEESSELPLDLSMDAVDLSTKSRDGNPIFRRKASLPRPRPMYVGSEMNSLVTSPFNPKREPLVHPSLPISTFSPHAIAQPASIVGAHPSHPAFLFPFGGPPGFNPFVIPQANVEKLIGLGSSSPPKIPNPFISASPRASYENRDTLLTTEKDVKLKSEPVSESKKSVSNSKSTSSSSASPTTSSSNRKRGENGNGEYQKPKQRRYRTERPFACPHCPARFTLRSNMERHGKHQHPTVWQRSPSNRVINRQKNQQLSPLVGPPTLVHPNTYTSNPGSDTKEKNRDSAVNVNVRAVIAQQLKRKLSNSSLRNNNNGSETETDPENTPAHDSSKTLGGDNSDLASVSQLLDRVKSSNFAQYFNEAENRIVGSNNDQNNSDDDGEGDESGEEEGMSSEEGDSKTSGGEKKKSAYSSAPHKISCPHCTRRFPWTSSLRRHLLTHTGQKPFQCSKCPLLFTTKSNCDRHLARKHSGANSKGASDSNNSSEDEEGEACEEEKDEEPETGDEEAGGETYGNGNNTCSSSNQSSLVKTPPVNNGSTSSSPGEDAAFRCHLCEAAAGERDALLAHMEENHKDTFHLLVSKGALSSSPPSENSETEQVPLDQRDVTHRKVMCVFCIRRFWSVEDLRRHIRSHSGERPFSCPHCSRRFTLKHSMLRHLKKHSNSVTPSRKITKTPKDLSVVSTTLSTGNSLVSASSGSHHNKNGDLIGRLLGLNDDQLVEKLLSQPDAKDAAKLLGLGQQQQLQQSSSRVTSKVT